MDQKKIERISELTRISRIRPLTEEETAERQVLRQEYIAAVRMSLESQLDNTYIVHDDGTKRRVTKRDDTLKS